MLAAARVKVKRGRIRHVSPRVVGHDRDVIADLVLVRIPFHRIKQVTHRNIRRPCDACVGAKGVK